MKLAAALIVSTAFLASVAEAKSKAPAPKAVQKTTTSSKTTTSKKSSGTLMTNYSTTTSVSSYKREAYQPDDRKGGIGVAATAGVLYFGVGYGMDLWYMAGSRLQLGLEANKVESEIDSRRQSGETAALNEYLQLDLTGFKAQSRFFVWNSLFLSGGVSQNVVNGQYGYYLGDTEDHMSRDFKATVTMAHFGIGNQWRFKNGIVFGGEWASGAAHLATKVKDKGDSSEFSEETGATGSADSDYDSAEFQKKVTAKLTQQIQFTLAMLTLGYEF